MSSLKRYAMPASVIHCPSKKSPSSPMDQVSRNLRFVFPPDKIEANFQEGYEHWFDFSRILLPSHSFCYEQNSQISGLEVGVCPPLIPAVQMVQSKPCWTADLPRKRNIKTREEQENQPNNQEDTYSKHEQVKHEEEKTRDECNSAKRKLVFKLRKDEETTESKEWKSVKTENHDGKEKSSSVEEEKKSDENEMDHSQPKDKILSKTKLEEYLEKRRKNNASAKKSREARRMRELQTQIHAAYLEDENSKLRTIVGALRKENTHLRELLTA